MLLCAWFICICLLCIFNVSWNIQTLNFSLILLNIFWSYCYTTKLKKKKQGPKLKKNKIRAIFFKGTKKSTSSLKLQLIHIWSMLKFFIFWFETLFFSCFNCWIWQMREKVFEQLHLIKKRVDLCVNGFA